MRRHFYKTLATFCLKHLVTLTIIWILECCCFFIKRLLIGILDSGVKNGTVKKVRSFYSIFSIKASCFGCYGFLIRVLMGFPWVKLACLSGTLSPSFDYSRAYFPCFYIGMSIQAYSCYLLSLEHPTWELGYLSSFSMCSQGLGNVSLLPKPA